MRVAAVALVLLGLTQLGCGGGEDCACGDPATLYVELPIAVSQGATVEVCFEDACGTAAMNNQSMGEVPWADLGSWPDDRDAPVDVSVVQGGEPISQLSGVADQEDGGCCGDYWVVRPD